MLSRIDYGEPDSDSDGNCNVDICDETLQVATINSNMIEPSHFLSNPTREQAKVNMTRPKLDIPDINMTDEQAKDDFLQSVRSQLSNNNDPPKSFSKYLLLDDVLYYVSEDEVLDEV